MRFILPASALALALATVSSMSVGKKPDSVIDPQSVALADAGRASLSSGQLDAAIDQLETALAVDPKNRRALILLAEVAEKQELQGKAIKYYREALFIEPNDVAALSGQGLVLAKRGALTKARENLIRIEKICPMTCPEQTKLAGAITKAEQPQVISAEAVQAKPVVTQN